ncbi:hypothetical protein CA13_35520 [Planctomycetes bacterium CA13]|uniref:Uncharacterized protein n=1 Tax=Novipirellula herctigrandis TaxID=2527986 RepID=A0A5C5Z3Y7_9BACT|nr:hypothetical protein CA13_35520 [Planctomycetes bacterium CA13]
MAAERLAGYFHADGRIEQLAGSPDRHHGPFPRALNLSGLCRLLVVGANRFFPVCSQKLHPFASGGKLLNHRRPHELGLVTAKRLPDVIAVFSSRLLPAFSGRELLTTTGSSDS